MVRDATETGRDTGPGLRTGWRLLGLIGAVASGLGIPGAVCAQPSQPPRIAVPAGRSCFIDFVRVSGFAVPRAETYVAAGLDGYRISDVLVSEGDSVLADQEVIKLQLVSAADPGPPQLGQPQGGRPGAPPSTISLRSPANGFVAMSVARVGGLASGKEPLMRITTDSELDLVVDIPSPFLSRVRAGARAHLLRDDGPEIETSVRVPATDVDVGSQFGRARVAIPRQAGFRSGMFARAVINTDRVCTVAVPRTAVFRQNNSTNVAVERNGRIEIRNVVTGLATHDRVSIEAGVNEGDLILTDAPGTK